jgi:pseudoazurin
LQGFEVKIRLFVLGLAGIAIAASPASAKEWRVAMVNRGANGTMDFTPAFLRVAPGDAVRFVAQDKSHNAESIPELTPAGGGFFKGNLNKDVVVKFTRPGLYAYKCLPHYAMGMVGLVEVGKPVNLAAFKSAVGRMPPFAKLRMTKFLQQVK